jgi:hypothetical protein
MNTLITEDAINQLMRCGIDTNKISDGYHTFAELYEHRIVNYMAICRMIYNYEPYAKIPVWMSKKHSDGAVWEGWFLLGIYTEAGKQITYHLPMIKWDECDKFARELSQAPEFDGHNSQQVLERLSQLFD